ncbi:MAG TPA: glycerol kinase GlpK [Woeseiaceae bacterium]|nr:glycerol kinase GlpK [Woeseiaceae bacterium]
MAFVLAIDQSTSATKALLFDDAGRVVDREARDHRQLYPQPGWVEHDAAEIWQNVLATTRALVGRNAKRLDDLACVSIANQRETVVAFDRATGEPLCPAIVWQCRRSEALCAEIGAAGFGDRVHELTGLRIDPYFSGSKLLWLARNRQAVRARVAGGDALVGTMDTYLVHRLTEGRVFATDPTNASRTLLYDIDRLAWDAGLCDLWDVPPAALAEVRESAANFGETTLGGALRRPVPIAGVMGDSQAALFAQRCFEPGMAKVTFGTGSSVLLNIGATPQRSGHGVLTALAWVLDGRPVYAFEGIIISSAATLAWLKDQLGLVRDIAEIERLAGELDDAGGVFLVPAFSGLGLPYWAPGARAAITGLSAHSDRRHVARAALESMAYQLRDALDAMQAESGVALTALRADGGPTANRLLMQFVADVTQGELSVPGAPECSAQGAAMMGMLGAGVHASLDDLAGSAAEARTYRPAMTPAAARACHAGWRRAVGQVLAAAEPDAHKENS